MDRHSKLYRYMYLSCACRSKLHFNCGRHVLQCHEKKRNLPEVGGKRDERVKRDYESQPSALRGGSFDVVCQEEVSPSPVPEALTIIEEEDKSGLKRVPIAMIQFVDILLRVPKQWDVRIASTLVYFLFSISFEPAIVKQYIKRPSDCKDVITRNTRKFLKEDGFVRVLVRGSISKRTAEAHFTLSMWLKFFKSMLNIARKMIPCSVRSWQTFWWKLLLQVWLRSTFEHVTNNWKKVLFFPDSGNVWVKNSGRNEESFVGIIQSFLTKQRRNLEVRR